MKFSGVCLIASDLLRLSRFYSALLQTCPYEEDEDVALFRTDGAELSIFGEKGMESMAPGSIRGTGAGRCILEFEVDDVDAAADRLKELDAPLVKPAMTYPWKRRSIWFRDPDGNVINIYMVVE